MHRLGECFRQFSPENATESNAPVNAEQTCAVVTVPTGEQTKFQGKQAPPTSRSARQSQTSPLWYVDHERCEGAVSEVQHFGAGTGAHHGCALRMRQFCKEQSTVIREQPSSCPSSRQKGWSQQICHHSREHGDGQRSVANHPCWEGPAIPLLTGKLGISRQGHHPVWCWHERFA